MPSHRLLYNSDGTLLEKCSIGGIKSCSSYVMYYKGSSLYVYQSPAINPALGHPHHILLRAPAIPNLKEKLAVSTSF